MKNITTKYSISWTNIFQEPNEDGVTVNVEVKDSVFVGFESWDEAMQFTQNNGYSNRPNFQINEEYYLTQFPVEIIALFIAFKNAGFKLYAVGGCIRDSFRGERPKDWDVCTDASPNIVSNIVHNMGWSILPIGEAFNIMAAISPTGEQYEIATFRKDSELSDGRKPESVSSATIEEDAERRDFTINSLYADIGTGFIIDPSNSGGIEDLKNEIIRCVGNPVLRFKEDQLRKLRAVRFALRFGFNIEVETLYAISSNPSLDRVSKERIAKEFRSMKNCDLSQLLKLVDKLGLIAPIFGSNIFLTETNRLLFNKMLNNEFKSTDNLWPKFIALWCLSTNTHPKNIFSKLDLLVDEKRLIEFLFTCWNFDINNIKTIAFKKMFVLLETNMNLEIQEVYEFLNDVTKLQILCLLQSDFVLSNDERFIGLEGKELGEAMERAQKESFVF